MAKKDYRKKKGESSITGAHASSGNITCLEDATTTALFHLGVVVDKNEARNMYSTDSFTPPPVAVKYCRKHGVSMVKVTHEYDKKGGREVNVLRRKNGLFLLVMYYVPKGTPLAVASSTDKWHAVLLADGHMINNWSTSKVIKIDDKDRVNSKSAKAAIRALDSEFENMDITVADIWKYELFHDP